jgi:hypothetical protein
MIRLTIHSQMLVEELGARGEMLQAAILETMGGLGERLQELAQSKIAPVIRTSIGQEIFDSIMVQAAAYVDGVCQTSVGIDNDGQPSYIVAYVREFGGEKWYDIYPHEVVFGAAGLGGAGRISQHSAEGSIAAEEGRLPHSLAWSEGGTMVFARHVWHPPALERSYLRSSLDEMQGEVRAALVETLAGVLAA